MTNDEMTDAFQRHMEAEHRGDLDAMVNTMSEDCYREQPGYGFVLRGGRPASRAYYDAWFSAFPPSGGGQLLGRAFGDDVMVLWMNASMTMEGDFLGIPATHRTASVRAVTIVPFRDGLPQAEITHIDSASWCEQIGIPRDEMKAALQSLVAAHGDTI
jgi:steroid delta-isomerase-like uncharacterized protein